MANRILCRFYHPQHGERIGVQLDNTIYDVTEHIASIGAWLRASTGHVAQAI